MTKKRDDLDEFEGEYLGNMWGWKFSFFSLGLIVIFSALIAFQYYKTGKFPMPEKYEKEQQEQMRKDSLNKINEE